MASLPSVKDYIGTPQVVYIEGAKKVSYKKNTQLSRSFEVITRDAELMKLTLSKDFEIVLFANSKLKVQGYESDDESSFVYKNIYFYSGRFYINNKTTSKDSEDFDFDYESVFFKWKQKDKQNLYKELFLEIDPQAPSINFCAGDNAPDGLKVSLFEHETAKVLKSNQGAHFKGVLGDNKQVAYDLLIGDRRVPKGNWLDDFSCDMKEILSEINKIEADSKIKNKKAEAALRQKLRKQKLDYERSACHAPNGQLNECLWKVEAKKCVRYRCNAEGKWTERSELLGANRSQCETKPKVSGCDY